MSTYKTIAKNTLFLYLRMFLTMGISLYTSRVVLRALGVDDFGIYNLVGGVVVLFSFLNAAMSSTTQRYINVAFTSKVINDIRKIFSVSLNVHIIISLVIIILSETIGLWFLNYKLNIPHDRMHAANVVYQISILTTILGVIQVPYNAIILSYEKLSFFAFLGIFESIAKLAIIGILVLTTKFDQLILYAILISLVSLIINIIYYIYCRREFRQETTYENFKDKVLFNELVSFSSWMLLGQVAVVGANQGLNMILNIFIGVGINATMGIANQVNTAIFSFVSNFQIAFRPQLIQSYAKKDYVSHKKMLLNTSKFSFFLMAFLSVPVLFFTKYVLILWLGDTLPQSLEKFVQLVILISLIDSLSGPFWMSAQAIGSIKEYNIVLTIINLLTVPLAYFLLHHGYAPVSVLIGRFSISIVNQIFRYYFINKYLNFNRIEIMSYFKSILIPFFYIILVLVFSYDKDIVFFEFVGGSIILEMLLLGFIIVFSINQVDRTKFKKLIEKKMRI